MYLPMLRTAEQVVSYFKEQDPETVVTVSLINYLIKTNKIIGRKIGSKVLVNFDECVYFFMLDIISAEPQTKSPRHMVTTGDIYRLFMANDEDTRVRKSLIKTVIATGKVFSVWLPQGHWLVDLDEFVRFFTGGKVFIPPNDTQEIIRPYGSREQRSRLPRLRHYEQCYHLLRRDYPQLNITWQQLHSLAHGGEVFCMWYNNRWIVDYRFFQKC